MEVRASNSGIPANQTRWELSFQSDDRRLVELVKSVLFHPDVGLKTAIPENKTLKPQLDALSWLCVLVLRHLVYRIGRNASLRTAVECKTLRELIRKGEKNIESKWIKDIFGTNSSGSNCLFWNLFKRVDGRVVLLSGEIKTSQIRIFYNETNVSGDDVILRLIEMAISPSRSLRERKKSCEDLDTALAGVGDADNRVPRSNTITSVSFAHWLEMASVGKLSKHIKRIARGRMAIDEFTVLDAATLVSGYSNVTIDIGQAYSSDDILASLDEPDRDLWKQECDYVRQHTPPVPVFSVTQFNPPRAANPYVQIVGRPADIIDLTAFERMIYRSGPRFFSYRSRLMDMTSAAGTTTPNILSTGIVVIINNHDKRPNLLFVRRSKQVDGFEHNMWAIGIAKIFTPITYSVEGRVIQADRTLRDSIVTALERELLGSDHSITDLLNRIQIHAFAAISFPMCFAIVDLRPLSFDDLSDRWLRSTTEDHAQGAVLAAVPLDPDLLHELIESPKVPEELLRDADDKRLLQMGRCSESLKELVFAEKNRNWQPNTAVRLLLSAWRAQSWRDEMSG